MRVRRLGSPVTAISTAVLTEDESVQVHPLNCALLSVNVSPSATDNSKTDPLPLARVIPVKTQGRVWEDSVTADIVKRLAVDPTERRGEELRRIPLNSTAARVSEPELTLKRDEARVLESELSHMNLIFDSTTLAAMSMKGAAADETVFSEVRAPELLNEDPVRVSASQIGSVDDSTGC